MSALRARSCPDRAPQLCRKCRRRKICSRGFSFWATGHRLPTALRTITNFWFTAGSWGLPHASCLLTCGRRQAWLIMSGPMLRDQGLHAHQCRNSPGQLPAGCGHHCNQVEAVNRERYLPGTEAPSGLINSLLTEDDPMAVIDRGMLGTSTASEGC